MSVIKRALATVLTVAACAPAASAQSADERIAAREVVKKRGEAVVMVTATLKVRFNVGGRDQTSDQQAQANGTVLDASGLTVLSLSTLQPDDLMSRQLSARVSPDTRVDVTTEPSEIKMHLADGREVPARLVLRDQDLDLAFIRPAQAPATPMVCVDMPTAKPSILDLLFVIQRTSEATGWSTAAAFGTVQLVIDKPQKYYQVVMPTIGGGGLGSPIFDPSGKFVGIILLRNPSGRGASTSGVLPADEIRDIAKQATAK
jgi:S1-C subfamily serine protease